MALKTNNAPVNKEDKEKPEPPASSAEIREDEDDPARPRWSRKAKENQDVKRKRDQGGPSMALLKAYEVHGHLDPRRRITVGIRTL